MVVIVAAALVVGFGIYRWRSSGFKWSDFAGTLAGVDPLWLLVSILFALSTYYGRALRWQVMLRPVRPDSSTWNILVCTAVGFTAIVFFGRAGELVRPYLISVKERVPFSSQMAAWILERVLDLMMVLLIFGISLSQVRQTGMTPGPNMKLVLQAGGVILGVAGAVCLAILLIFRNFSESAQKRVMDSLTFLPETARQKAADIMRAFSQGLGSTRGNAFAGKLLAFSVLEWVLIILCFVFLFKAFPSVSRFSLTDIIVFLGFVSLGAAIQIPGIGGGLQVAAVLVLTELFGMKLEVAAGFAVILWAVTFVTIVPFGVILGFREGLNWGRLSHVSEETQ